jgi:hypothetical protein
MKLFNTTLVTLTRTHIGGLKVAAIRENPIVPSRDGKPVFGPYVRRLLTVKEIAHRYGLSLNYASLKRRSNLLACLADLPGQVPIDDLLRAAA